ncbi:MAG: hypothetical protein FWD58_05490 [Firmicutes bacterium]|nr:hypothetical protein [Bacillota bacterium]
MKKKIKKLAAPAMVCLLAVVLGATAFIVRFTANPQTASASTAAPMAASGAGNTLSLVEINNEFDVMVLRATQNKTLIYVSRLYFDYSPLSSKRLAITENEDTDYVIIDLVNEANEWAKLWGYVRQEEGVRPDDPQQRIMTLNYLEINQYFEWRTFTNEERWAVSVNDGYKTVDMTFDLGDRKDGAVYHIDGVYGLPEHYYPQIAYWWDLTSANPDLVEIRNDYMARAAEAATDTPEGEPLRLNSVEYSGSGIQASPASYRHNAGNTGGAVPMAHGNGNMRGVAPYAYGVVPAAYGQDGEQMDAEQTWIWLPILAIAMVVILVASLIVTSFQKDPPPSNITDAYDPAQRTDDTPPAPSVEQQQEYNEIVEEIWADMTEEEQMELREELERRKEFSLDHDAPAGQKIVKLKVKDMDGILQPVYDEDGQEVFVNRKTHVVGNSTFACINRETLLLIRFYPATMELRDVVGNRITVNADSRLMNLDGVQPYSPKSRDDVLRKMGDMGHYTSAIDPGRMLFRMDDEDQLRRALNLKENDPSLGFWGTIGAAFKNLFGGGGTSKGFLSNFLDVLILVGVVLAGFLMLYFVIKGVSMLKRARQVRDIK